MRKIARIIQPVLWAIIVVILSSLNLIQFASAQSIQEGVQSARGTGVPADLFGSAGILNTVINILLFVVGALAVVMLIIGGIRYTVSGGNASAVTNAKNTVLYAIVGLVIAFLAYAAINFVFGTLSGTAGDAGYTDV